MFWYKITMLQKSYWEKSYIKKCNWVTEMHNTFIDKTVDSQFVKDELELSWKLENEMEEKENN